jgi:hypothetical protein
MVGSKGSIDLPGFEKHQISRADGPAIIFSENPHEHAASAYRGDGIVHRSRPLCPMNDVASDVSLLGNYHDSVPARLIVALLK